MKQLTYICLLTIAVGISGCDRRDELIISNMVIHDFQIHVSDIDEEIKEITRFHDRVERYGAAFVDTNVKYYAVSILVSSGLGGCLRYDRTRMFYNIDKNEIEIDLSNLLTWHGNTPNTWVPGGTLRIEITESEPKPDGSFDCTDDYYDWYQTIFIGFCVPGEYTIVVNNERKTFMINGSDGTVHIHDDT